MFTCICHLVSNVFPISSHHENADHGDQNVHNNDDADSDDDDNDEIHKWNFLLLFIKLSH